MPARVPTADPDLALAMIESLLGPGLAPTDLTFEEVVQSFPDLIALRSGRGLTFPDAVAYPDSAEAVRALLAYAEETGSTVIPYGGGTSVVGHVNVQPGAAPVVSVDLSRLDQLVSLDPTSQTAVFGAGISGAQLESALGDRGFTLGHFPQSVEYSTLGGWEDDRWKHEEVRYRVVWTRNYSVPPST